MEPGLRTALIVPVAGLPDVIDLWRERTCAFKPSAGLPPHCDRISFDLGELRRFPATLYLAPEPSEPFAALTEALADRYPDCEPHVHAFGEVVPHLTVAEGGAERMEAAEDEIKPLLPIRTSCESAVLLAETSASPTHWAARAHLLLKRTSNF